MEHHKGKQRKIGLLNSVLEKIGEDTLDHELRIFSAWWRKIRLHRKHS